MGRTTENQRACIELSQYLPLGCFVYSDVPPHDLRATTLEPHWHKLSTDVPLCVDSRCRDLTILLRARWIRSRRSAFPSASGSQIIIERIYVLPDDVAHIQVKNSDKKLSDAMDRFLTRKIDTSLQAWNGHYEFLIEQHLTHTFDKYATSENASLYFLFNTLPSPDPSTRRVDDRYSRRAIHTLLEENGTRIRSLKTLPYAYQRRAAAAMIERETATRPQLDPRFEPRTSPDGQTYYYNARDRIFRRQPDFYDGVRGGILAESMGHGKTYICIMAILSTKGHLPRLPPQYTAPEPQPGGIVRSLFDMAALTICRQSIPWRGVFDDIKASTGQEMTECIRKMEQHPPYYLIPPRSIHGRRSSSQNNRPKRVEMCSGTIIVVPRNLVHQWRAEFEKHVEIGVLRVLYMDQTDSILPPFSELATYDVVVFSDFRFGREGKGDGYVSPLSIHLWLRIIIDEGHDFSSRSHEMVDVAQKVIRAERRWIVSGTPARDLLSVDADIAAMTNTTEDSSTSVRERSLQQRKGFDWAHELTSGAIKSIGDVVTRYLHVQPWYNPTGDAKNSVKWDDCIFRHEDPLARTYTCFSKCLRTVLQSLVIKTRPEHIERDLVLPPLTHDIVRLDPCFFDLLSANLFVLIFLANAITSEREDTDYLFHPNNPTHLSRLITNLRQSGFFWTGFNRESVEATLKSTEEYLAQKTSKCCETDRKLMRKTMNTAKIALDSLIWEYLAQSTEMALIVNDWPADSITAWAFAGYKKPMILGLTQCLAAQKFIHNSAAIDDALNGLAAAGNSAKATLQAQVDAAKEERGEAKRVASSVTASSLASDHMGNRRISMTAASKKGSPSKTKANAQSDTPARTGKKRRLSFGQSFLDVAPDSALGKTRLVGTTSTKLSYLLDRVMELHEEEKILIFYDSETMAYYISQALDLLAVNHLIYAKSLTLDQRSKYIVLFDTDPLLRVLVMDLKQAAHGLNLSSASRVFFVNPTLKPNVEAQAIKRAHRIGQTRPVRVETLILRGTVEEALQNRANSMSRKEHLVAAKAFEQDDAARHILQNTRVIPISEEMLLNPSAQMARLAVPQRIFGRVAKTQDKHMRSSEVAALEAELFGEYPIPKRRKVAVTRSEKQPRQARRPVESVLTPRSTPERHVFGSSLAKPSHAHGSIFGGDSRLSGSGHIEATGVFG